MSRVIVDLKQSSKRKRQHRPSRCGGCSRISAKDSPECFRGYSRLAKGRPLPPARFLYGAQVIRYQWIAKTRTARVSKHDGDGSSAKQTTERSDISTDGDEPKDKEDRDTKQKKFHVTRKTLIIGGIVAAVLLIGVFLYWLHARNFESTDDAYKPRRTCTRLALA